MLSRVANSIFWMARYIERAENTARFVDVAKQMTLGHGHEEKAEWAPLLSAIAVDKEFKKAHGDVTAAGVAQFLLLDRANPNSVFSCVASARENARTIRESVTSEMWGEINRLYHRLRALPPLTESSDPAEIAHLCGVVKAGSLAFGGISAATLTRGNGWDFLRLGTLLERADKTSRLLDVKYFLLLPSVEHVGSPLDQVQWSAVLRSVSALEMYRQRHGSISPQKIVSFLVLDAEFPRSILFCLSQAVFALKAVSRHAPDLAERPTRRLGRLRSELAYGTLDDIEREGVHQFLDRVQTELNALGKDLGETYFHPELPEEVPNLQTQTQG